MLEESKKVTFSGDSKVEDVVAERYSAQIDEDNPENLTFGRIIMNGQLRKENREECRKDQAQFEDDVYAVQDEMISQDAKVSELKEED